MKSYTATNGVFCPTLTTGPENDGLIAILVHFLVETFIIGFCGAVVVVFFFPSPEHDGLIAFLVHFLLIIA